MSYISRWLLLVSVISQLSNLEAILYWGHFFDTPCIIVNLHRSTRTSEQPCQLNDKVVLICIQTSLYINFYIIMRAHFGFLLVESCALL